MLIGSVACGLHTTGDLGAQAEADHASGAGSYNNVGSSTDACSDTSQLTGKVNVEHNPKVQPHPQMYAALFHAFVPDFLGAVISRRLAGRGELRTAKEQTTKREETNS
jgi:hypothetical protein